MSPETLDETKPSCYPAQMERIPRRRHATGASLGGATGSDGGRRRVLVGARAGDDGRSTESTLV
jgi:hypothetical protein